MNIKIKIFSCFLFFPFVGQASTSEGLQITTKLVFEKILSEFQCAPYTLESQKNENDPIKKSEVVSEIFKIIASQKDFSDPPESKIIKFEDLTGNENFFHAAQVLRAMNILETTNGKFGNKKTNDPELTLKETNALVRRAFSENKCGFVRQTDQDFDGIENQKDLCPNLPAQNTLTGCPAISQPAIPKNETPLAMIQVAKNKTDYSLLERIKIKANDFFKIIFRNPKSKTVITESNTIKVNE